MSKKEFDKQIKNELLHKTPESLVELYLQAKWELELKDNQLKELEEENEKLKQNLEFTQHGLEANGTAYCCACLDMKNLKEQIEELKKGQCKGLEFCLFNGDKDIEISLLRRQLQELPKKICDEIRDDLDYYSYTNMAGETFYMERDILPAIYQTQTKYEKEVKDEK